MINSSTACWARVQNPWDVMYIWKGSQNRLGLRITGKAGTSPKEDSFILTGWGKFKFCYKGKEDGSIRAHCSLCSVTEGSQAAQFTPLAGSPALTGPGRPAVTHPCKLFCGFDLCPIAMKSVHFTCTEKFQVAIKTWNHPGNNQVLWLLFLLCLKNCKEISMKTVALRPKYVTDFGSFLDLCPSLHMKLIWVKSLKWEPARRCQKPQRLNLSCTLLI